MGNDQNTQIELGEVVLFNKQEVVFMGMVSISTTFKNYHWCALANSDEAYDLLKQIRVRTNSGVFKYTSDVYKARFNDEAITMINYEIERDAMQATGRRPFNIRAEYRALVGEVGPCKVGKMLSVNYMPHQVEGNYLALNKDGEPTIIVAMKNIEGYDPCKDFLSLDIARIAKSLSIGDRPRHGRKMGPFIWPLEA